MTYPSINSADIRPGDVVEVSTVGFGTVRRATARKGRGMLASAVVLEFEGNRGIVALSNPTAALSYTYRLINRPTPDKDTAMTAEKLTPITAPSVAREGDVVIATKDETVLRGKLKRGSSGNLYIATPGLGGFDISFAVRRLLDNGYTLKRIEPPMPTEPGAYTDKNGRPWLLASDIHGNRAWTAWDGFQHSSDAAAFYGPFVKIGA